MKQYQNLLIDIISNGQVRESARQGMPKTIEVFNRTMVFDLKDGFPILTTKRMSLKNIATELLWFLHGDTNVRYLNEHGCRIWNADAYKLYRRQGGVLSEKEWLDGVTNGASYISPYDMQTYKFGDCGDIYGKQWRSFGPRSVDQIGRLLHELREHKYSRYHVVTAWNPSDFFGAGANAALPACHMMFQCYVNNNNTLDLMMLQRSCDTFLGVPYNIASYALLIHLISNELNLIPGRLIWTGNCVHLYENHLEQARELIKREPYALPKLSMPSNKGIFDMDPEDLQLIGYESHPAIKAPLSVGV